MPATLIYEARTAVHHLFDTPRDSLHRTLSLARGSWKASGEARTRRCQGVPDHGPSRRLVPGRATIRIPDPVGVTQPRVDDPYPKGLGRLFDLHADVIVVHLDDQ